MYNIKFYPKEGVENCFSGELWIEKGTYNILKVDLSLDNTDKYPFIPLFPGDSLYDVSLNINNTYKKVDEKMVPNYMNFDYKFTYNSVRDTPAHEIRKLITREISAKGLLYFYDYGKPFILPFIEYNNNLDDYKRMSIVPYNEMFWDNNNTILLTEDQKQNLGFFSKKGKLVNLKNFNHGDDNIAAQAYGERHSFFFEHYNVFWSAYKRLTLRRNSPKTKPYPKDKINKYPKSELYNIDVQILLDVTNINDSLHYRSFTVLDTDKTFYHLPEEVYTRTFMNIYFDICEIERRKMNDKISESGRTLPEIKAIYNQTKKDLQRIKFQYFKEVEHGARLSGMHKWNKYVLDNLDINNMELVKETDKQKGDSN